MSKFRGEYQEEPLRKGAAPQGDEFEEDRVDEDLAGMPNMSTAWYSKFAPVMITLGVLVNVFEITTSAGGAVEVGLASIQKSALFSMQDIVVTMTTATHDFPMMLVGGILLAVACQTCLHLFAQPLQVSFRRVMSLAQKKQLLKHGKRVIGLKSFVCLLAIAGCMFTDAVFLFALFGSIVLTALGVIVFPFISTYVLYHGIALKEEVNRARIIEDESLAMELNVMRKGMEAHFKEQYYGGQE